MSVVDAARDAAARLLLLDVCNVDRPGEPVFDPNTGLHTVGSTPIIVAGACNLTPFTGVGFLTEQFGGEAVDTSKYQLSLPWDAAEVRKGDIVTMVSSADPDLAGRRYSVVGPLHETFQTARRLVVEEILTTVEEES